MRSLKPSGLLVQLASLGMSLALFAGCSSNSAPRVGSDAGPDAGSDAGPDAGSDAGPDAGSDAGPDAGSDAGPPIGGDSVLMHHKNPSRDGLYIEAALTRLAIPTLHKDPTFAPSGIVGEVYAQPLFVDGQGGTDLVIVATESDNVYALDAASGAQVWMTNVGTPVPLATLATCGDIDPVGITGTPVIDPISRTLFLDAELIPSGSAPTHRAFALSVDDGSIRPGWPIDVPSAVSSSGTAFTSNVQGQRGALAVLNGRVYIPYGGRYGDCGDYHGWVVGISISNPASVQSWSTPAQGGGVWAPGGIATDGTNLYGSTGNTFDTTGAWGGGDGIITLTPGSTLSLSGSFAPANWLALDDGDLDMGTGPVLIDLPGSTPGALAIAFGKDGDAYLIDRDNPGGVGPALGGNAVTCTASSGAGCATLAAVATDQIISAATLYTTATATYVSVRGNGALCTGGTSGDLLTLKLVPGAPPTLSPSWCGVSGSGSPMVTTSNGHADAIVWSLGAEDDNRLHAFDGDSGAVISFTDSTTAFPGMRRYNTPIAAKGRIFVPVDGANGGVIAFKP